jgi:hypothetical protein
LEVVDALEYRILSFRSTLFRLRTLEKRMLNVIQLAFNTSNQEAYTDTLDLKLDSRAMKGIAAMTLIFLPITGVASVFSTPFFQTDPEVRNIKLGRDFWIFWAFVIPLTITVIMVYRLWYSWDSGMTILGKFLGRRVDGHRLRRKKRASDWV